MRRPAPFGLCVAATAMTAVCHASVLDPRGPVGQADKTILIDSLAIMLAIVVPTIVATLGFAWWYRASNERARYLPEWAFSGQIELVVWAIPVMVIILLGGVSWIGSQQLDPARPLSSQAQSLGESLDIQVVSLDWKWLFIYPHQRIASVNQLVVPAGVPLHFSLTSGSVMNAFFVPQLGSMIYTMNGMATELYLQADHPGTFRGISAHYSGDGFSDMHFDVRALPSAQFDNWIETTQSEGRVFTTDSYSALARQSANMPVATYKDVDPELFNKIVLLALPPGPGPATARAGAAQAKPSGH